MDATTGAAQHPNTYYGATFISLSNRSRAADRLLRRM